VVAFDGRPGDRSTSDAETGSAVRLRSVQPRRLLAVTARTSACRKIRHLRGSRWCSSSGTWASSGSLRQATQLGGGAECYLTNGAGSDRSLKRDGRGLRGFAPSDRELWQCRW